MGEAGAEEGQLLVVVRHGRRGLGGLSGAGEGVHGCRGWGTFIA